VPTRMFSFRDFIAISWSFFTIIPSDAALSVLLIATQNMSYICRPVTLVRLKVFAVKCTKFFS
jgi:hypothetical protein